MKRLIFSLGFSILLLNNTIFSQNADLVRDGKLLEGDKWIKFSYPAKADFYVAPNGNDSWSGTLPEQDRDKNDGPFLTIGRAQKAVRDLKSKVFLPKDTPVEKRWIGSPHPYGKGKDILVYIRSGHYSLAKPLQFDPEDGGERVETNLPTGAFEYHKLKDHYVTYAAYPGERPVITGEKPVTGWKKSGKTWTAHFDSDSVSLLIVNGQTQILARTPDKGYFVPPAISTSTDELYFREGDIRQWKDLEGNRIIMLLRWHRGINSILSVDEKSGIATLQSPQEGVIIVPPRYYVENIKSLLNAPGEWFFDKKLKELSYIPMNGLNDPEQISAGVPVISQLVGIEGRLGRPVRNLRLYGLIFEGTSAGNNAVTYRFAHACEFADNEIRSCGGTGVAIKEGCYQTRILNNTFEMIENGGVYANGPIRPVDGREITRETTISYNRLYNCGGINIFANYTLLTTISHNYITKTRGRYGIDVGGWANLEEAIDGVYLVEYNHLDDVQLGADDSGAIKTAGMTFNSIVRRNLIHNVNAGFFNDNVGFWFDNMSSGWTSEENIFYNLEQGEMKLCAAMPEDNIYRNNFTIEQPVAPPELIIEGNPEFKESNLTIEAASKTATGSIEAGSSIHLAADVFNSGSSGIDEVNLYIDGKIYEKRLFPVIKNNCRKIEFDVRLYDEGEHSIAVGSTPYRKIKIEGTRPSVVFEDFKLSEERLLQGESIKASATARNLTPVNQKMNVSLFTDNAKSQEKVIELSADEKLEISFETTPPPGLHKLRIENSAEKSLNVFEAVPVNIAEKEISRYCSAKAKPYQIESIPSENKFIITAGGSDFFHAEDSYAAVYLKGIRGDFVARVTISGFGNRTHEWFRSGLFVRNDISKSFDVLPGSKGSVLVFATPGRAGIEYDEFANGCMHKASSQNLPENSKTPIYLKMVRHGNSFSGYISLDGKNWIIERHTGDIPGIDEAVDLGLAAGGPDKQQYTVEFSDWKIVTAKQ